MFFDAHADIWYDVTRRRLAGETQVFHRHHFQRFQKGGVEGGIFAIWIDPPFDANYISRTRQIMACATAEIAESTDFRIVRTCEEIPQIKREGKLYVFIGAEGLAAVGRDAAGIDGYYEFGVRHASLTWNEANALGAGALSGCSDGLTEIGKQVVHRMQKKGILLDVSHLNEAGFWDVVRISDRPFVASHSNARALCDVPRNLTDDQLRAIRDAGGVVGLNAFRGFVDRNPTGQTVERLAQHAAHMIDIMGIDHVGCGFDFCEYLEPSDPNTKRTETTKGLEDCAEIPNLFTCFTKMGMNREYQEKIARENFLRVLQDAVG